MNKFIVMERSGTNREAWNVTKRPVPVDLVDLDVKNVMLLWRRTTTAEIRLQMEEDQPDVPMKVITGVKARTLAELKAGRTKVQEEVVQPAPQVSVKLVERMEYHWLRPVDIVRSGFRPPRYSSWTKFNEDPSAELKPFWAPVELGLPLSSLTAEGIKEAALEKRIRIYGDAGFASYGEWGRESWKWIRDNTRNRVYRNVFGRPVKHRVFLLPQQPEGTVRVVIDHDIPEWHIQPVCVDDL